MFLAMASAVAAVAVYMETAGRVPDGHCKWLSDNGPYMRLACSGADDVLAYPFTPQDFDEHTLAKAEAGDPRSMTLMGMLYSYPGGVHDPVKAMTWFRKAADKGDAAAMFGMGSLYDRGGGIAENPAESSRWLLKAAAAGHVAAMFVIALHYDRGYGVAADPVEAARWIRACADAGDTGCMMALSHRYRKGRGVPKDEAEADRWQQRVEAELK